MYWNWLLLLTCLRLTSSEIFVPPIGDLDWWQNSIIYEIFPLSFKDSNGDGSGDFKGITEKLDYLADIGVTAIWLTPFLESPLKSGGYDISNYLNVQKVFGTLDDFKELLNTAHKKNIKVIMDFVPNHTSDEHIWFKNSVNNRSSTYGDYYIWKNAKNHDEVIKNSSITPIVPNNWKRICGFGEDNSAWIWDNTRNQFYFVQFSGNLPDLNFRNEDVHKEMKKILNYWIELGIDGIRIDALKHLYESENMSDEPVFDQSRFVDYFNLNHIYTVDQDEVYDVIKNWHQFLNEFKKKDGHSRIIMTESYSSQEVLFKYYTSGAEIPTNFNLMYNYHYNTRNYNDAIRNWITTMPNGATYNVVLQNHDQRRFPTSYGTQLINGMNALSLFLPGVAIVYYGGEIGMEDIPDDTNYARSPMQWDDTKHAGFSTSDKNEPWIQVHPNYVERNVKAEINDPKSYLNFFKAVSKLRQTETMKRGGLATYIFNETVFVINRFLPGNENYTLIFNMDPDNSQHVHLSDQIQYSYSSLTVIIASGNSNFESGNLISTESFILSPGGTIILSDYISTSTTPTTATPSIDVNSSGTQLYITFNIILLCLYITY